MNSILEASLQKRKISQAHVEAMMNIDFEEVKEDIRLLLTQSDPSWPADYGNYGPMFIRMAWHMAGSYRRYDGRGGADGGRQRFDPERSWNDNTNLDKARSLLWPIKEKYGMGLSWGDLFVLTGNTAIESMGGPVLGFCGGRIDDEDGSESILLGPSPEQERLYPCDQNGTCTEPLGSTTVGLIYMNPEGPNGVPIAELSVHDVRDAFGRMAMNDSETVALIGGGHSFGKTHGACPDGPGNPPNIDPEHPWEGNCGTGKGEDTYTSGFEFPWTTTPTEWNTEYFQNLVNYVWAKEIGPGDHYQWRVVGDSPSTPSANGTFQQNIGMLTTDIALIYDDNFFELVKGWANNLESFNWAFSNAWYKLMTRDMGPVTRCIGNDIPPPQPFQYPLPPPPETLADFDEVKKDLIETMKENSIGEWSRLAWQCASTFRQTDYMGGCNGARIRFSPQKDWLTNVNIDQIIESLKPIKEKYESGLSWADLIVLAGSTALEQAGVPSIKFCGGRTDGDNGAASDYLFPIITGEFNDSTKYFHEFIDLMGMTRREYTALHGAGYSIGQDLSSLESNCGGLYCKRNIVGTNSTLSNNFFSTLLANEWEEYIDPFTGKEMYVAVNDETQFMLKVDLQFKFDAELLEYAQEFASDYLHFEENLAKAWTKLMNSDRFDGPTNNLCDQKMEF